MFHPSPPTWCFIIFTAIPISLLVVGCLTHLNGQNMRCLDRVCVPDANQTKTCTIVECAISSTVYINDVIVDNVKTNITVSTSADYPCSINCLDTKYIITRSGVTLIIAGSVVGAVVVMVTVCLYMCDMICRVYPTDATQPQAQAQPQAQIEVIVVQSDNTMTITKPVPVMLVATSLVNTTCSICLDNLDIGAAIATPCQHNFHQHCIDKWLQVGKQCPNCYRDLFDGFEKSHTNNTTQ